MEKEPWTTRKQGMRANQGSTPYPPKIGHFGPVKSFLIGQRRRSESPFCSVEKLHSGLLGLPPSSAYAGLLFSFRRIAKTDTQWRGPTNYFALSRRRRRKTTRTAQAMFAKRTVCYLGSPGQALRPPDGFRMRPNGCCLTLGLAATAPTGGSVGYVAPPDTGASTV